MTRLAELIEQRGTTVQQLADEAGIPWRTVYRHVNGETTPNLPQAAAYAQALNVPIEALLAPVS